MNLTTDSVIVSLSSAAGTACADASVADLLAKIRAGEWAARVQQVRSAFASGGKSAANAVKATLPGVLWSGRFLQRRADKLRPGGHSGIICADFDNAADPVHLRAQLAGDPLCLAAFISPTATGVKALYVVDPTRPHKLSWRAVDRHVRETHGLNIDAACKDVARLCFASHDPDAFIASGDVPPVPYPVESVAVAEPATGAEVALTPGEDFDARGDVPALLRKHGWSSEDNELWAKPGKDVSEGHGATLNKLEGHPRAFFPFYENAAPFASGKPHSPFEVFTLLECGGDFAEATAKLSQLGFGSKADLTVDDDAFLLLPSASGLTISESAAKIFPRIAAARTLFMRGGIVQEIAADGVAFKLAPVPPRAFRSRLEKFGRLMVWRCPRGDGKRVLAPTVCPEETASALLATTEARDLLPHIRTISTAPVLAQRGDELVALDRGWHPENGGVFVTGDAGVPSVELHEAVDALLELLADFDFASAGDKSRAVASLVTPAVKASGLLPAPTPVEAVEADKSQAGKGYLSAVRESIYGEVPQILAQKDGGVGSFDESLSSALVKGRPFIRLDNLRGKLSSTFLEAVLTANGPVPCRVPHQGEIEVDVRPFTFSLTSNGIEVTADLANRCSIVRIRKRPPGYPFRHYAEGDLLAHIRARQPYYLGCVFAVVGAWFMDGCQRTQESRHDFRQWSGVMDWIVQHVFGLPPLMDGHEAARDRVADQNRSWLRAVALAVVKCNWVGTELMAGTIAELCSESDIAIPNCRTEDELGRAQAVGRCMGRLFAEQSPVTLDGFTVHRAERYSATAEKSLRCYRFDA